MTEEKFMSDLKARLKATKKNSEMTINDINDNMAECAPVSKQCIRFLFAKNSPHVPKVTTLKVVCDSLGITLAEFFDSPEFNEQLTFVPEKEFSRR